MESTTRSSNEVQALALAVANLPAPVAEAMGRCPGVTVIGGGETDEAVEEFELADKMTHVSTGGGAFLEYLEGTPFPALDQIDDKTS